MFVVVMLILLLNSVAIAESLNDQIIAKSDGDLSISRLIAQGVDVNAIDYDGFTPLTLASRYCRPKTLELLLKAGADINKIDYYGVPPLYHTVVENCAILTKVLIDYGANVRWVDKENGNNLLHYASLWGADIEVIDLVKAGADINGLNNKGESPLRVFLNWKDVSPWFKKERTNLLRRYGAKDVYARPQSLPTQPTASQSKRRKNQPDEIKRDSNRPSNHKLE